MDTTTINLRDIPTEVARKAKARAAILGLSLKDFVIKCMEDSLSLSAPYHSDRSVDVPPAKKVSREMIDCSRCEGQKGWMEKRKWRECSQCKGSGKMVAK